MSGRLDPMEIARSGVAGAAAQQIAGTTAAPSATSGAKTTTAQVQTTGSILPDTVLKKGVKSNDVTLLQQALNAKGYNLAVDGSYGGATQAAVIAYQKSMGLTVDGIAGRNTLTSLGLLGQPAAATTAQTQAKASQPAVAAPATTAQTFAPGGTITSATVLKKGVKSGEVALLQQALNAKGYNLEVDGSYGGATQAAVLAYQKSAGLSADGVAGVNTLTSLGLIKGDTAAASPVQQTAPQAKQAQATQPALPTQSTPPVLQKPSAAPALLPEPKAPTPIAEPQMPELTPPVWEDFMLPEYVPRDNPYLEQLDAMVFDYNPFEDEDYIRQSAEYEQQIADMMVGRGGLWSSVTSNALQTSLLYLQHNMTQQKYEEFKGEREFVFSLARFTADENQRDFQNYMTQQEFRFAQYQDQWARHVWETEFAFEMDKEKWKRQSWAQEFEFAREQEAWKRDTWQKEFDFAINQEEWKRYAWTEEYQFQKNQEEWKRFAWQEEFNFQRAQAEFNNRMAEAQFKADEAERAARLKLAQQQARQSAARSSYNSASNIIADNIIEAEKAITSASKDLGHDQFTTLRYLNNWSKSADGKISGAAATHFGVPSGTLITSNTAIKAIEKKINEIGANEQILLEYASVFGKEKETLDYLNKWVYTPTPAKQSTATATTIANLVPKPTGGAVKGITK